VGVGVGVEEVEWTVSVPLRIFKTPEMRI